jgi:hypothetical protein
MYVTWWKEVIWVINATLSERRERGGGGLFWFAKLFCFVKTDLIRPFLKRRNLPVERERSSTFWQDCQIFLGTWYQKWKKCTKWTQNVPNGHKISKMSVNNPKDHKNIIIFQSRALQNLPKSGFLVWKETIWQPCFRVFTCWAKEDEKNSSFLRIETKFNLSDLEWDWSRRNAFDTSGNELYSCVGTSLEAQYVF